MMRVVWGLAIAAALVAALWFVHRQDVAAARRDEAQRIGVTAARATDSVAALLVDARREADSLRAVTAARDTVLVTRLRTIRDTAWLPADTTPVVVLGACRAQLDSLAQDCDAFRQSATAAIAKADTNARRDAAVIAGLSLQLAGIRRADSLKAAQGTRTSKWRSVERGVCVASVAGHVILGARR